MYVYACVFLYVCTQNQISLITYYTPGIYAKWYIVFAFPFACSFAVHTSITFVELTTKFFTEFGESFSSGIYLTNHS